MKSGFVHHIVRPDGTDFKENGPGHYEVEPIKFELVIPYHSASWNEDYILVTWRVKEDSE